MVAVAQLVEPRTVTPAVAGSNPVGHPIILSLSIHMKYCSLVENISDLVRSCPNSSVWGTS